MTARMSRDQADNLWRAEAACWCYHLAAVNAIVVEGPVSNRCREGNIEPFCFPRLAQLTSLFVGCHDGLNQQVLVIVACATALRPQQNVQQLGQRMDQRT